MSLIIETGDGLPDADSFVSVPDCADYAASHGLQFPVDSPPNAAEAALRRATAWIDGAFRGRYPGRRRNGRGQALEWPRTGARDAEGNSIPADEVPAEIIRACCEAAIRELSSPGSLSPDVTPGERISQASVTGAVSVTYSSSRGVADMRPVATVIDDILSSLIGSRPGNSSTRILARA